MIAYRLPAHDCAGPHAAFGVAFAIITDDFPFWVCVLCHEGGSLLPELQFRYAYNYKAVPS